MMYATLPVVLKLRSTSPIVGKAPGRARMYNPMHEAVTHQLLYGAAAKTRGTGVRSSG